MKPLRGCLPGAIHCALRCEIALLQYSASLRIERLRVIPATAVY